jgi:hypothetical protein
MAPLTPAITQVIMSQPADLQQQLARLGQQYLSSMRARIPAADADQVKYTADKMLRNLWLLGYIQLILPRSCVVHVLRHPMDVALSCYAQPFGYSGTAWSWDLDHIVQQIQMTWQLADHWDQAFPGEVLAGQGGVQGRVRGLRSKGGGATEGKWRFSSRLRIMFLLIV